MFRIYIYVGRVAGGCCQPQAPSEPCVRVSPHTAQASVKASPVEIPAHYECTSCYLPAVGMAEACGAHHPGGRHLLSPLSSDLSGVHMTKDPPNVCRLAAPGMSHPVSRSLQSGIRFFRPPVPARRQHALRLACPCGRRDRVSTFRIVHPMGDLGAFSTPVVRQFRAGSYETRNLTTRRKHREAAFDLLIPVGLCSLTALANIHLISPYHPFLALDGGGFSEGFSCHHLNPIRYFPRGFAPTTQRMVSTPV